MPIDPATLVRSLAPLTDLDPVADLASTLDLVVVAAKQLFGVDAAATMFPDADGRLLGARASDPLAQALEDHQATLAAGPCLDAFTSGQPAIMHDATLESRWGAATLALAELQIRSALSVPIQLGGGPIGTLDVYAAAPWGWDATEVSALQTYAGLAATLLGTAATADPSSRLAAQLKVALTDRARLDDQQAPIELRPTARSSRPKQPTMTDATVVRLPLAAGQPEPAATADGQLPRQDIEALDDETANRLEQDPGGDWIGRKLRQLLLGFLATEMVPLANQLAGLGIDPTPLFTTASSILRRYADALDHPDPRR